MINNQNSVKKALLYGFICAVAFPLIYECYVNVMRMLAIGFALAGCVYVAIRLSKYELKDALCASAFFSVVSLGLGVFLEIMLHDSVVKYLEEHSKYFYMSLEDVAYFVVKIFLCYATLYAIVLCKFCLVSAVNKIKSNAEQSATFIDKAFDDDDE